MKMMIKSDKWNTPWQQFSGANLAYMLQEYDKYKENPSSVDPEWSEWFARWGEPLPAEEDDREPSSEAATFDVSAILHKAIAVERLAQYIRNFGHLTAIIDPLGPQTAAEDSLNLARFNLNEEDLRRLPADIVWRYELGEMQSAYDAIIKLKQLYSGTLAFQFGHVHEEQERAWLRRMVETGGAYRTLSEENRSDLLLSLIKVEEFENFLHRTFVGQKRFSIEGLDVLVPMVDEMIRESVFQGAKHVLLGMAHRGRLNMLAHVLGKPYENIFSEFQHAPNKEMVPSEGSIGINFGWSGDVKYHLGADRDLKDEMYEAHIKLANNPSHLEFVNPVVVGYTRAAQEDCHAPGAPVQDTDRAYAILIHGDAAFPGEGIVAETLNISRLQGYQTGGTIHIIANNQIGFTTEMTDSRSTKYASDLAEGFEIPIVHVNADDPEACIAAVHLANEYRKKFKKDFLIDVIGYRKYGHNEMDDPEATQPLVYQQIHQHPSVREQYVAMLMREGLVAPEVVEAQENAVQARLQEAYENIKVIEKNVAEQSKIAQTAADERSTADKVGSVAKIAREQVVTAVPLEILRAVNEQLLQRPADFHPYPKLDRILQRRQQALDEEGKVEWALAETLAFATILREGTPIRLSGQDSERGTFAHRHIVLHDELNGNTYTPLQNIAEAKATFAVYNSPLSEAAVLGFEYGYDVFDRDALVLWEAQFGDFANAAQVIIDQFLVAGQVKWRQKSSIVLLLPHGYEGQGPEHSSARLERFLQMAAENNCRIVNLTSAAQYFHLLREQALLLWTEEICPLVIMTPKSLLRHTRTASTGEELSAGSFQPVLGFPELDREVDADQVERLILCSGKVAIDLLEELESGKGQDNAGRDARTGQGKVEKGEGPDSNSDSNWADKIQILRVEQLYPFPLEELKKKWLSWSHLRQIVWVQEEPRNMGAWTFVEPRLRAAAPENVSVSYIGRPNRASPAGGFSDAHKHEQRKIVQNALYGEI